MKENMTEIIYEVKEILKESLTIILEYRSFCEAPQELEDRVDKLFEHIKEFRNK